MQISEIGNKFKCYGIFPAQFFFFFLNYTNNVLLNFHKERSFFTKDNQEIWIGQSKPAIVHIHPQI